MNVRRLAVVAGILSVGILLGRAAFTQPAGQGADTSLSIRHARVQVRLAELNLEKVKQLNQRMPSTLIASMVAQFAQDVELAKLQLQIVENKGGGDAFNLFLVRAQGDLRMAETRAKQAADAHQRAPAVISAVDVERTQLGVELAQLQLERGKAVANGSFEAKVTWQFELLIDELQRVRQQIYLLSQNRFPQF